MRTLSTMGAIVLLSAFWHGCKTGGDTLDRLHFHIDGRIYAERGDTAYLKLAKEDGYDFVDSARVDTSGHFHLQGAVSHAGFYILHFSNQENQIMLLPDTCQRIAIDCADDNYTDCYTISGSPESEKIASLVHHIYRTRRISDSLGSIYRSHKQQGNLAGIKQHLDSVYSIAYDAQRRFSEDFINSNPQSLVQVFCLSQYIAPRFPVFDSDKDYAIYRRVADSLGRYYPENFHVRKLCSYVDKLKALHDDGKSMTPQVKDGDAAPEISLRNIRGENISLSQYKGKYVLVDFCASWSDVSRRNTENLLKVYWKYYNNNFTVLQVSIEESADRWKQSLKDQNIPWQSVSDLRLWNSQAVLDYGVKHLPASFLVYPDQTVHGIDLSAMELDTRLLDLVGKPVKKTEPKKEQSSK